MTNIEERHAKAGNKGVTVPASVAHTSSGWDPISIADWKGRESIVDSNRIKLVSLSHMRYQYTDLGIISTFLEDFGLEAIKKTEDTIWWRGYGTQPYVFVTEKGKERKFLGGVFEVESYAELEKAARLPGAGKVEKMEDAPGGGFRITLMDPSGFPISLVAGQEKLEAAAFPDALVYNFESKKNRNGDFQRFTDGLAAVNKLGHFGLIVTEIQPMINFYSQTFNLVPSDFFYVPNPDAPNGRLIVGFFAHIELGDEYVDHHSFFVNLGETKHVHHCSFEVHDFDTQLLGHHWLAKRNYKSVWGVGRHVLGSQIFDYWWDPAGNMVEHYADGDRVNQKSPIGFVPAGDQSLFAWGPDVPAEFLR